MGLFSRLFRPDDGGSDDVYSGLREQVLRLRPADIGIAVDADAPVFGVVMEMGRASGSATFVCLGDGTVSLYTSTGGGVIGAGQHESVREACRELLAWTNLSASDFMAAAAPTTELPLPGRGRVFFYLLTPDGVRLAEAREKALERREHAFANLYAACHGVLARVREAADRSADAE